MSDKGSNITALVNNEGMTPSQLLALIMDDIDKIKNLVVVIEDVDGVASVSNSAQSPGEFMIASVVLQKRVMNMLDGVSGVSG